MKMRAEHHGNGKSESSSEVSLTPMNLTTMLSSAKRSSEHSLSPRSPVMRPGQHQRDLDDDIVDSSVDRDRRSSGDPNDREPTVQDLKSQFLADLRRLGNIPTQSSTTTPGQSDHQPAPSSTTHSPPIIPTTPTKMEEENLPPRKRKVSQEHQQKSPYNGLHETGDLTVRNDLGQNRTNSEDTSAVECRN